jgi:hypothetical protein
MLRPSSASPQPRQVAGCFFSAALLLLNPALVDGFSQL